MFDGTYDGILTVCVIYVKR